MLRTPPCELALILVIATALDTGAAWLPTTSAAMGMVGSGTPAFVLTTYALVLVGTTALGLIGTIVPAQ